jgi:diguanylate cyclase (GGDEF)-like protein
VLVVDDDRVMRAGVRSMLGEGFRVVGAMDGRAAEQALALRVPDAIVLDLELPDVHGEELLRRWRGDPRLCGVPVVVLTSHGAAHVVARLLGFGAFDFVAKPPNEQELRARVTAAVRIGRAHRRLQSDVEHLRKIADTDELTKVLNRRGGERHLEVLMGQCAAGTAIGSVARVDLDAFKSINDVHGHAAGDEALVVAAHAMAGALRQGDVLYRSGGDEFVAVLTDADAEAAEAVAGRLRLVVAAAESRTPLSASVAVATWEPGDTAATLLDRADDNLYAEKGLKLKAS